LKEHQMFLRQRWQRLMVSLANLLLKKEEERMLSKRELDYFFYCLENLKTHNIPAVLNLLSEYQYQLDNLDREGEKAIREIINSTDWTAGPEESGVVNAIKTTLELLDEKES